MQIQKNTSRRDFLRFLGVGAAAVASPGLFSLAACSSASRKGEALLNPNPANAFAYGEELVSLAPQTADSFLTAPGFMSEVFLRAGDVLNRRGDTFGWNCDFAAYLPLAKNRPDNDGFLFVNHEYPHPLIVAGYDGKGPKQKEHVDIEMRSVGISITRIRRKPGAARWSWVRNDRFNRRIDGTTRIPFAAGVEIRGSRTAVGTLSNCAGGITPWGTFLTCEENPDTHYGDRQHGSEEIKYERAVFKWYQHYAHPPEHYSWVVEVDPRTAQAKKLTALGRFGHEGATVRLAADGRAVAYMGDDMNGGCVYKFISRQRNSLEHGDLYVADFKAGRWILLNREQNPILKNEFKTQLDVNIYTRKAAQLVGGTPMDRPEDIEINPMNGDVVIALTNNIPAGNHYGSLLRLRESGANPLALEFTSENILSGGLNSGFACPDNLAFDPSGNLWFSTDIGDDYINQGKYAGLGNNAVFVVPVSGPKQGEAVRVASGPVECELTGIFFAPKANTLFVAVQHPGANTTDLANPTSNWPEGGKSLPKPSLVQITGPALERITSGKFN